MAPRLPNAFIYLSALIRPARLRPDLRVKTIGSVDFAALRRDGFNAVVVDKDNCLTLPEQDDCYPPFKEAWSELLASFDPGRVLVVSNSAGTRKDPSGIAAESVSHHLKTPVLVHAQPKPGCGPEIIKYFRGELGRPTTRLQRHLEKLQDEQKQMQQEFEVVLQRHQDERLEEEIKRIRERSPSSDHSRDIPTLRTAITLPSPLNTTSSSPSSTLQEPTDISTEASATEKPMVDKEDLRILVVGDRLFTDTLLAHRLRLLLPSPNPASPTVLSIHTTSLPQPRDVRPLRWLEERLSRGRLRDPSDPWARFTKYDSDTVSDTSSARTSILATRWEGVKADIRDSRMGWDPRKWTVKSIGIGLGKGLVWTVSGAFRVISTSTTFVWTRSRRFYLDRRKAKQLEQQEQKRLQVSAEAKILGIETGRSGESRRISAGAAESIERIEHKELPMIEGSSRSQSGTTPSTTPSPAS